MAACAPPTVTGSRLIRMARRSMAGAPRGPAVMVHPHRLPNALHDYSRVTSSLRTVTNSAWRKLRRPLAQ